MTELRAALVTPTTGPLARFGRAGATALTLWAEHAAELPAPWSRVDLEVLDAAPDPGAAVRTAVDARPDVLLVVGGFEDEVAAAGALLPGDWRAAAFVGAGVDGGARADRGAARGAARPRAVDPFGRARARRGARRRLVCGEVLPDHRVAALLPGGAGVRRRGTIRPLFAGWRGRRRRATRRCAPVGMHHALRRISPGPDELATSGPPRPHRAVARRRSPRRLAPGAGRTAPALFSHGLATSRRAATEPAPLPDRSSARLCAPEVRSTWRPLTVERPRAVATLAATARPC